VDQATAAALPGAVLVLAGAGTGKTNSQTPSLASVRESAACHIPAWGSLLSGSSGMNLP
jgi:hypothetical protein